jgi:hypothetical protein
MAALHRLRFLRDYFTRVRVEHGRGAGIKRGIDGEDQHRVRLEPFRLCLNAAASNLNFNRGESLRNNFAPSF